MEHKFEYGRRLLSHVLHEWAEEGYERNLFLYTITREGLFFENSWESIVGHYDSLIKYNKKRLGGLKKDYCKMVEPTIPVFKNINIEIEETKRAIDTFVFIRHLLGKEKNWVEKMLRN